MTAVRTGGVLWHWPDAAAVRRVVPKTKFYAHARIGSKLRAAFVAEIEQVTWAYKLAPKTVGLTGDDTVAEIQVFTVEAKPGQTVSAAVLAAIDASIPTPIVFEERHGAGAGARLRTRAAFKRPGPRGPVVGDLLDGDWLPAHTARTPLPVALDLAGLYALLLAPLLPLTARPGESMPDVLERVARANRLAREVAALERQMRAEAQPNRKLDLRRELHARVVEYDAVVNQGDGGTVTPAGKPAPPPSAPARPGAT